MSEAYRDWVDREMERCGPWLDAALDAVGVRTHAREDVRERVIDGRAMLFPMADAVLVAESEAFPAGVSLFRGWLAGGRLDTLQRSEPAIADHARKMGHSHIGFHGRGGWVRAMFPLGYREVSRFVAKEL